MGSSGQRAPLDAERLAALLTADARWPWGPAEVVDSVDSTNAELARRPDIAAGAVLVAEEQTAGRGRLDRRWDSPARAGLWMSVAVRPEVADWTWLPLLAGVAVVDALDALAPGLDVGLKWPNDIWLAGSKAGGILVERHGSAAIVGIGIDVHQDAAELAGYAESGGTPAVSLALAGAPIDRTALAAEVLGALAVRLTDWQSAAGDAVDCGLAAAYRAACRTVGWWVRVGRPAGDVVGRAVDIDAGGRLIVHTPDGPCTISAGDVTRVRPVDAAEVQG